MFRLCTPNTVCTGSANHLPFYFNRDLKALAKPSGHANRRKLSTFNLRCVSFGRAQIRTQVLARFHRLVTQRKSKQVVVVVVHF